MKNLHLGFATLAGLGLAFSAQAQNVPTQVDPSKVEERFNDAVPAPVSSPAVTAPVELPRASGQRLSGKSFTLKDVSVEGATVYNSSEFTSLFQPLIGKKVTLAEVQASADQITAKYRSNGYILAQAVVPAQETDGSVRIRVVEGYVNNVIVQGEVKQNSWRDLFKEYGEKIKAERPLNIKTLERYLLLMDDLPGATARGTVRPSPDTFGAADLVVDVKHDMFEGSASIDNRGTRFLGEEQYTLTAAANSVLGLYERTLVRGITTSPTSELAFFDIQHEQQVGSEGTRVVATASHAHTEPNHTLKALDIDGNSKFLQLKAEHPFIRSRAENLRGRAIFDYRNTDTDVFNGTKFTNDRVRALRLGGGYDFSDSWRGVNLIEAQASQGLDIFNASESGLARSRGNGESDFTKFNLDLARTQALPWSGFSVLGTVSGQYSLDELLASEQFAVGGIGYGSAYDPAELTGDHGVAAKAELRYGESLGYSFLNSYQAFAYYDIGAVWNKDNTTPDNHTLASTGLGVRANFVPWLSGSAEVGFPLTKKVAAENDDDPRFFFSLTSRF